MSRDIYPSVSGAAASWRQLEVVANNLSNAGTAGFKAQRVVFQSTGSAWEGELSKSYVRADVSAHDMSDGPVQLDGDASHIALQGRGFFAVQTADGADVSPALAWGKSPAGTKSLALICDDPDAPAGTWVHWVVWNLPPTSSGLPKAVPHGDTLAGGGLQGKNGSGKPGYSGPAPPSGTHRYFFKLYALDTVLDLPAGSNKAELLKAMEGHIIGSGELMGRYSRDK